MAKRIIFDTEARTKLLSGALQLAKAVRSTMGPKGRNVVLEKPYGGPVNTNDGVTIAREIDLEDPFENMGAQMVREAATKTNDAAGDGTTTATVLAVEFITNGLSLVNEGANPVSVKNGIHKAVTKIVEHLKATARKVTTQEEIAQVAGISAADPAVGSLIAEIMEKIGKDGVITVEEGQNIGLSYDHVDGMQLDSGYTSSYMVTDQNRMECVLENPMIIVTDRQITSFTEILKMIEEGSNAGKKSCVIFADDVSGDALANLLMNKMRGIFTTLVVRTPGFGERRVELSQDIAAVTGATFISNDIGVSLKSAGLADTGAATRVIATKDKTIIVNGAGSKDAIAARKAEINNKMEATKPGSYDMERLRERLARISGGVAVIRVGAATEVELTEKRHRLEDAVSATRAAVEEGIVPGGGMTLLNCIPVLKGLKGADESEQIGIRIVTKTLSAPIKQIIENAGQEFSTILAKLHRVDPLGKKGLGYDADADKIVNMYDKGIIDPTKVVRCALQNAASVAAMFLTTGTAVVTIPEKVQPINPQQ